MLSVLPGKAKEERKYPHVTADVTWMRLIISGRSRVVSVILWPILLRLTAFALTNIWTALPVICFLCFIVAPHLRSTARHKRTKVPADRDARALIDTDQTRGRWERRRWILPVQSSVAIISRIHLVGNNPHPQKQTNQQTNKKNPDPSAHATEYMQGILSQILEWLQCNSTSCFSNPW